MLELLAMGMVARPRNIDITGKNRARVAIHDGYKRKPLLQASYLLNIVNVLTIDQGFLQCLNTNGLH